MDWRPFFREIVSLGWKGDGAWKITGFGWECLIRIGWGATTVELPTGLQRLHFYFTVGIALSSSAAALSLLTQLPDLVSVVFFFMVAGAVAWTSYADYSKKAAVASVIGKQRYELSVEWKQLWFHADDDANTPSRAAELERRLGDITHLYDGPPDDTLNERCAEEAYEVKQAEFSVGPR